MPKINLSSFEKKFSFGTSMSIFVLALGHKGSIATCKHFPRIRP